MEVEKSLIVNGACGQQLTQEGNNKSPEGVLGSYLEYPFTSREVPPADWIFQAKQVHQRCLKEVHWDVKLNSKRCIYDIPHQQLHYEEESVGRRGGKGECKCLLLIMLELCACPAFLTLNQTALLYVGMVVAV